MSAPDNCDLIIIGGGPAGAAAGIQARLLGLRACILEADRFPRHHVGESLIYLWPVFERLGIAEEMDGTFLHKYGSTRVWGCDMTPRSSDFEYRAQAGQRPYSLQVERSLFDSMLLNRAARLGVDVRQGCRVRNVLWDGERAVGVQYSEPDGSVLEAHAPFIVDATGRAGLIARQRRLRATDPFYPDLSVYGYFTDVQELPDAPSGGLSVEAVPWGWFWFIPLHTGEVSIGIVCDPSTRAQLRAAGVTAFFREALAQTRMVGGLLAKARLVRGPFATASSGYRSSTYSGPGWVLAGDAAMFIDPMWATGVANALSDGRLAATVVHGVLSGHVAEPDALSFFDREVSERAEHLHAVVKFVYAANHLYDEFPFWERRHRLAGPPPSPTLIRRVARDPSAAYFFEVFGGMGVDEGILTVMEAELRKSRTALPDPASWIPRPADGVTITRAVGIDAGRAMLVRGLELNSPTERYFTGSPAVAAAFEAVDGHRTVQEIVSQTLLGAPADEKFALYLDLTAAFVYAGTHELLAVTRDSPARGLHPQVPEGFR